MANERVQQLQSVYTTDHRTIRLKVMTYMHVVPYCYLNIFSIAQFPFADFIRLVDQKYETSLPSSNQRLRLPPDRA